MFEKLSMATRIVLGKIIIKILFIPVVRRRFETIVYLYEMNRLKKELDMLNRKQVCMNFRHYLPDTEERIERCANN